MIIKRRVEQLVFPDKEEADAAKAKLNEGTDWETLLEQRGVAPGDIDLGLVAREDIIDQSVADAVFSMAEGSVSDVIEGRFGPILARVTDIQLASTRPFEEVAGDIKQEIARDEAIDQIFSVRDAVEDSIAGGASLAEVATANGLTLRQVAAVSETGLDESDTVITDLPLSAELISGMYASDIGIENPPLEGDNEFVWYEVTGVTPERERTLEEVSDRVQEDWIRDETAKALDALASSLAGNLKSDVSFTALAEARDKPITPYEGITRLEGKEGLAAANIATIFEAKADSFGFLTPADPTQRLLFQVTEVTVPAYFEEEQSARQIAEAVAPAIENELLVQYVAELQTNLGVSLNQALLSQMLAGTPDQRR